MTNTLWANLHKRIFFQRFELARKKSLPTIHHFKGREPCRTMFRDPYCKSNHRYKSFPRLRIRWLISQGLKFPFNLLIHPLHQSITLWIMRRHLDEERPTLLQEPLELPHKLSALIGPDH